MKKVLSLVLVLALAIVPMTAMASDDVITWQDCTTLYSFAETVSVPAGETVYFEMGAFPDTEAHEFVVSGLSGFEVAVCGDNGDSTYKPGTAIADTNGVVETSIVAFEATYGYAAFSITNKTTDTQDYDVEVVMPKGTQGNPDALTLAVGGTAQVTVPAGGQYYINAKLPSAGTEYQLTITGNTGFGYVGMSPMPSWDTNGVYTTTVAAYNPGAMASFSIANKTGNDITCTLALAEVVRELGDESNPDALPMDTTTTKALEGNEYWYTWTATEAGTLTITMVNDQCSAGWTYKATCDDLTKHFSTGWDESDKNVCEFTVVAGDVVTYGVSVPTYYEGIGYDVYTLANGTVVFTTAFVAGEGNPDGGDGGSGDDGSGSGAGTETGTEINANYYFKYQELTTGANEIMAQFGYPTTLYTFVPTEAGEYKVTIDDQSAQLGYFGSNEWFPFDYTESKTYELTLNATEANAPMLIGVSNALNATITITRSGDAQEEETIDWTVYDNKVTPENFTFTGDANKLQYVDTEDTVVDKAVLGADGYYHLNSADGPILYANINDQIMSLVGVTGYGKLTAIYYDENDEIVEAIDFTDAITEYAACADATTSLYPLTEDLMTMFQKVGETNNWYGDGENVWVGGTEEDAWMYACYYIEGNTTGGTTTGGNTTTGSTSGSTTNTDSPKTGDSTNVAVWAIVMVVAAGAAFVVAESKRRAR